MTIEINIEQLGGILDNITKKTGNVGLSQTIEDELLTKTYWTYDNYDFECDTFEEIYEIAEQEQFDMCESDGVRHSVEEIEFKEFKFDDSEDGKDIVSSKIIAVEYHYEGSSYEQHSILK